MKKFLLFWLLVFPMLPAHAQQDSLKNVWKSNATDSTRYQALVALIKKQFAVSTDSALHYADMGIADSKAHKNDFYLGEFLYFKEVGFRRKNENAQALIIGKSALDYLTKTKRYTWAAGMCRELGECYISMLKYDSAIIHLYQGLEYSKMEEDHFMSVNIKQTIAFVYELMQDADNALKWNRDALQEALANQLSYFIGASYLNIGNVYDLLNQYDSSLYYKQKSLNLTPADENEYLILTGNIGNTYIELHQLDSALTYTLRFQQLASSDSYSQYVKENQLPRAHLNLGRIYLLQLKPDLAIFHLQKALSLAKNVHNEKHIMNSLNQLYMAYEQTGNYKQSLSYFKLYKNKADSAYTLEKEKVVKDTEARYQTALKQKEIADLKNTALIRKYLVIALVVFSLILVLLIYLYFKGRNNKLIAETVIEKERLQKERFKLMIETEEKERKRIARELHDGLGQMLSTVRLLVSDMDDNNSQPKVVRTLGILDSTIAEVRTISHSMMPITLAKFGFTEAIKDMVSNINETQTVTVSLDLHGIIDFPETTSIALYRSLQEIINNALKYAKASRIDVSLEQERDHVRMSVQDNGKGFDLNALKENTGIGWNSIYSRVELLGGQVQIESALGKGTKVTIMITQKAMLAISA